LKAKRKAEESEVATRLQNIHDKIDAKLRKLRNNWAKFYSEKERRKADVRKVHEEKREAETKVYENMMVERKAGQEKRDAGRKAQQEDLQKILDGNQAMADGRLNKITDAIIEDMNNDRK
jgi:hypothetical protein